MIVMVTAQHQGMAGRCLSWLRRLDRERPTMGDLTKRFGSVALVACIVAVAARTSAQQRPVTADTAIAVGPVRRWSS